jgi:hypothetical protein
MIVIHSNEGVTVTTASRRKLTYVHNTSLSTSKPNLNYQE